MPDYLEVIYDYDSHPKTSYPHQLAKYLFDKYSIQTGQKLLEPGCGRGDFLSGFQSLGLDCCGLDLSAKAGIALKNLEVMQCNLDQKILSLIPIIVLMLFIINLFWNI